MKSDKLKEIEKLYDEASNEYDVAFNNLPEGLNMESFQKALEPYSKKCGELSRKIRLIKEPNFTEISDFGDVMSLEHFIENVKCGGFIDYDGYGLYVKDNKESDIKIRPSDVEHNSIRKDFDTIIWFNR